MDINLALGAGRRLSVDIANLSFRIALLESERETMTQLAMQLTPGLWERPPFPEMNMMVVQEGREEEAPQPPERWVRIEGEQCALLDQLIVMFHDLV
jgi:hypothetical protein